MWGVLGQHKRAQSTAITAGHPAAHECSRPFLPWDPRCQRPHPTKRAARRNCTPKSTRAAPPALLQWGPGVASKPRPLHSAHRTVLAEHCRADGPPRPRRWIFDAEMRSAVSRPGATQPQGGWPRPLRARRPGTRASRGRTRPGPEADAAGLGVKRAVRADVTMRGHERENGHRRRAAPGWAEKVTTLCR